MSSSRPNMAHDTWSFSRQSLKSSTTLVDSSIYTKYPPSLSSTVVANQRHPQMPAPRPQAVRYSSFEHRQEQYLHGIGAWASSIQSYPAPKASNHEGPEQAFATGPQTIPKTSLVIYAGRYLPGLLPTTSAVQRPQYLDPMERYRAETRTEQPFHALDAPARRTLYRDY